MWTALEGDTATPDHIATAVRTLISDVANASRALPPPMGRTNAC